MRLRTGSTFIAVALFILAPAAYGQVLSQAPLDLENVQSNVTVADLSGTGTYFPGGFQGAAPAGPSNPLYEAGSAYNGVARLLMNIGGSTFGCTGALLNSQFLLTAAHCVYDFGTGSFINGDQVRLGFFHDDGVTFEEYVGAEVIGAAGYSGAVIEEQDIALVRLGEDAASWITRYDLFNGNPMYQDILQVGYGLTGNGVTGGVFTDMFTNSPTRRVATNSWEMTADEAGFVHINESFTPETSVLVADFDGAAPGGTYPVTGGTFGATTLAQNNRSCNIFAGSAMSDALRTALCHTGYGIGEGLIGSGDSGGPAFVNVGGQLQIAGVASWGTNRCVPSQTTPPRTSPGCPAGFIVNGSYFGSLGGHVAVSYGANYEWVTANSATTGVVPEPMSLLLLGTGLVGVAGAARRRRTRTTVA